jgi:hypothetical protein
VIYFATHDMLDRLGMGRLCALRLVPKKEGTRRMWEIAEFCFLVAIIWTVGTIHQDLKRLSEKVDRFMETAARGSEPR